MPLEFGLALPSFLDDAAPDVNVKRIVAHPRS
jgi:hypothetical protein